MSKTKPKPEKASRTAGKPTSEQKNEEKKTPHVCGVINGVMGKGAFTKQGQKWLCVECGKACDKLPEGYLEAKKKLNPKSAALLEKGSRNKTTGKEHDKWSEAGRKAWETRRANEAAKAKKN
jgi:hypothetical protein